MYHLSKEFRFEAAHRLPDHDGKCARLHGHSWRGVVHVSGHRLEQEGPKAGMLLDYGIVKGLVADLVEEKLDHHYLNETLPDLGPPTSENLARFIYDYVQGRLVQMGLFPTVCSVTKVTIEETCTSACVYDGERMHDPRMAGL